MLAATGRCEDNQRHKIAHAVPSGLACDKISRRVNSEGVVRERLAFGGRDREATNEEPKAGWGREKSNGEGELRRKALRAKLVARKLCRKKWVCAYSVGPSIFNRQCGVVCCDRACRRSCSQRSGGGSSWIRWEQGWCLKCPNAYVQGRTRLVYKTP